MSKIEVGARVKVTHNKARDSFWDDVERETRRLCDGQIGEVLRVSPLPPLTVFVQVGARRAWFGPDELTPVDAPEYQPSDHVRAITRAAEGLDRVVTVARENAALWRADVDALQAAIRGLTGKGGTVASMVGDLADVARAMAALKAAVEAATGQRRDKVVDLIADLGAMGAAWVEAERREAAAKSIADDATIALAKEQSVRRGAVEARDKAIADREALEARIQVAQVALDAVRLALEGCEDVAAVRIALDRLDRALRGVAALDQRVAGLGNGLDEVRRPKVALFATERGDLRAYCDRGDQVGGVTRRDDVWDWYSRRPFEAPTAGYDVPTREAAIAAMRAVLSTWAEIVDGAPPAAAERQEAAELSPSGRDAGAFGSNSR